MIELDPSVLEAVEKVEASYEATQDGDLLLLREYVEDVLPPRDSNRIARRFCSDALFQELAWPVFMASIEARRARQRIEDAELQAILARWAVAIKEKRAAAQAAAERSWMNRLKAKWRDFAGSSLWPRTP